MGPNTLDEYVAALSECRTADDVFATYRGEMQREGFQNIVFAHFMPNGEHEIPFLELPSAMPRVYLAEKFIAVSYTHLRAHETVLDLVCRLLLEKKNNNIM